MAIATPSATSRMPVYDGCRTYAIGRVGDEHEYWHTASEKNAAHRKDRFESPD